MHLTGCSHLRNFFPVCLVVNKQRKGQADCLYFKYWFICLLFFVLFLRNLNKMFLFISISSVHVSTSMARYWNKATPHLVPPDPTSRGDRIPTERERSLSNWMVYSAGGGEARKGTELVK